MPGSGIARAASSRDAGGTDVRPIESPVFVQSQGSGDVGGWEALRPSCARTGDEQGRAWNVGVAIFRREQHRRRDIVEARCTIQALQIRRSTTSPQPVGRRVAAAHAVALAHVRVLLGLSGPSAFGALWKEVRRGPIPVSFGASGELLGLPWPDRWQFFCVRARCSEVALQIVTYGTGQVLCADMSRGMLATQGQTRLRLPLRSPPAL